jgi:NADH-quinone oxidoreductase subunit L
MPYTLVGYAVFLPLVGFLINGLLGRKIRSEAVIGTLGSATVGIAFVCAVVMFSDMLSASPEERTHVITLFSWINAGGVMANFAYQVDQLSILMMLIVTGVGFLIHVYSIGYMHGDPGFWRFFAYLNLFIFAMLNLVMADNFLLMFLGWEGVGLCSYLLIGFWYDRNFEKGTTGDAARKAFIVNRIGDFGFLIGMFLIVATFGSLEFRNVFPQAAAFAPGTDVIMWITLALFLGATGKSAQIPLFVWLPDAMAGPTPVSALIHAATMVTAGVYMVARCSVLFALAPVSMLVVAIVGAATAFLAATIGLVQNDIKKILAYSTVSQLGYMFLALGVGAFAAGLFHVLTHAFFKALLFLGSGAVIHAMHEEQDIQKMGGLKSSMPVTSKTFLVGAVAIAGIPPLSGFFSKDEILWKAFSSGHVALWLIGVVGAGLTAFYMFRLYALTFEGKQRWGHDKHPHEAPGTMTVPLIILAFLSIIGGFVGVPASLGGNNAIEHWLDPVFEGANRVMRVSGHGEHATEYLLMALSVGVASVGIYLGWKWYATASDIPGRLSVRLAPLYRLFFNKWYVDEMYDAAVVSPTVKGADRLLWKGIDIGVIDWTVNALARSVAWVSQTSRVVQTGIAQNYVFVFLLGVVVIIALVVGR